MAKTRKTKPTLVLPDVVAKSPVMRRHRITAKSLPKFNRDMLVAWSPTMLHVWFTKTWEAAMEGSKPALDDIAEIYGLIAKRGAGSMVNVNVGGQMAVAGSNGQGFDAFIRELNSIQRGAVRPADGNSIPLLPAGEQ